MTSALYAVGSTEPVPQTEEEARPGLEPLRTDGPAEATEAPDWNELHTDDSGQLIGGLSRRTVAGDTHDTLTYLPWWSSLIGNIERGISTVFNRQADMGTAAAREVAGEQGHGTMQYAVDIDPVIRPGQAFGNDYFSVMPKAVQEGAGFAMQPIDNDTWLHAVAQERGVSGELRAQESTLYRNFYAAQ